MSTTAKWSNIKENDGSGFYSQQPGTFLVRHDLTDAQSTSACCAAASLIREARAAAGIASRLVREAQQAEALSFDTESVKERTFKRSAEILNKLHKERDSVVSTVGDVRLSTPTRICRSCLQVSTCVLRQ